MGVLNQLKRLGILVTIRQHPDLHLPALCTITPLTSLRPIPRQLDEQVLIYAGVGALQGQGIVITLTDMKITPLQETNVHALRIHDMDLLVLINELRHFGAEAIAINGHRIGLHTAIDCVGPTIRVNGREVASPFIISAIGEPKRDRRACPSRPSR